MTKRTKIALYTAAVAVVVGVGYAVAAIAGDGLAFIVSMLVALTVRPGVQWLDGRQADRQQRTERDEWEAKQRRALGL